jgi:hypothetical protein
MSRLGCTKVRDFSFNPGVGILTLDVSADCGDKIADLPNTAIWCAEVEA